jgi:hypothetical protein
MLTDLDVKRMQRDEARERIATACLAAMLSQREEWAPGNDGRGLAEIACEYAESLLRQLEIFSGQRA